MSPFREARLSISDTVEQTPTYRRIKFSATFGDEFGLSTTPFYIHLIREYCGQQRQNPFF